MSWSTLTSSIVIRRPLAEVVAFVDDCNNDPLWQSAVWETVKLTEGDPAPGTIYHVKEKFLGRIIEQQWEVVSRNADGSQWTAKTVSGPFPMETTMKFEPVDGGTRVTRILNIDASRFFKLAEPIVLRLAQRELDADFATLKEILEAES